MIKQLRRWINKDFRQVPEKPILCLVPLSTVLCCAVPRWTQVKITRYQQRLLCFLAMFVVTSDDGVG